jgi:hypothetical protein
MLRIEARICHLSPALYRAWTKSKLKDQRRIAKALMKVRGSTFKV